MRASENEQPLQRMACVRTTREGLLRRVVAPHTGDAAIMPLCIHPTGSVTVGRQDNNTSSWETVQWIRQELNLLGFLFGRYLSRAVEAAVIAACRRPRR